jgi:hypothetical protein
MPKFPLGRTVITRNALGRLAAEDVQRALGRHAQGDWGELPTEDVATNQRALEVGGRLFSAYHDRNNTRFWIITEADRSATTVLLPEDY